MNKLIFMNASSNENNIRILVTGAGGPAGIDTLKLLSKQPGVEAIGADVDPLAAGRFFAHAFELMARVDSQDYAKDLKRLIEKYSVQLVVPTVSEELGIVRNACEGLDVKILISPDAALTLFENKQRQYEWLQKEFPAHCPRWTHLDDPVIWDAETYFLKPNVGRGARGCRLIKRDELDVLAKRADAHDWLAMDVLPGTEWTVDAYLAENGEIAYVVPRERLALAGGISAKGRTVRHDLLIAETSKLIQKMGVRGPVCVQWKADASGVPKYVECNPRLSGAISMTAMAGADPTTCFLAELRGDACPRPVWNECTIIRNFEEHLAV